MVIPTTYIEATQTQVTSFMAIAFLCSFLISLAVYVLLPKKIPIRNKIIAVLFIFIGIYGLFAILLQTLLLTINVA